MIVAENEPEYSKCTNLTKVEMQNELNAKTNETNKADQFYNETNSTDSDFIVDQKLIASLNRYRKKPLHCYNKYENESSLLPCSNANVYNVNNLLIVLILECFFFVKYF